MTPIKGFAMRNRGDAKAADDEADDHVTYRDASVATTSSHGISTKEHQGSSRETGRLRLIDSSIEESRGPVPHPPLRRTPRRWKVTGGADESEQNRDRQKADELVKLVQTFNREMEEAKRCGLIVELNLSTTTSQFGGEGSTGHMLSIKVFRKLT